MLSEREVIAVVQDLNFFCRMRLHLKNLLHVSAVGMEADDVVYSQRQRCSWWLSAAAWPESHPSIYFFKCIGKEIRSERSLCFSHVVNGVSSLLLLRFQLK